MHYTKLYLHELWSRWASNKQKAGIAYELFEEIAKRLFDFPRMKILIDGNLWFYRPVEFVLLNLTSWQVAVRSVPRQICPNPSEALGRPLPRLKPENGPFLLPLCQNVPQLPQLSKTHTNICLDLFCTPEYCLIYICILTSPSNWKCNEVVYLSGVASLSQSMWIWVQAENENSTFIFGSKPRNLLTFMNSLGIGFEIAFYIFLIYIEHLWFKLIQVSLSLNFLAAQ